MEFLKNLLRSFLPSQKTKKTGRPDRIRRTPQIESLEAREMLAVSILSSPVEAYAQQDNPAEIRFELSTPSNATTRVDFVAKQITGSTLDPSAITLVNRTTGTTQTLSSVIDGKTQSSASAFLKSGSYSIFVYADSGKGGFTLDIRQEQDRSLVKSGLDVLVAAAISQQQAGWSYRIGYYNGLLSGTDYAGAAGMKPIATLYPEVDVNGDGVVNGADLTLAEKLISGNDSGATVSSVVVVAQDLTAPTVTVGLKNDTGTAGDRISTDATLVGRVTDTSGLKSIRYKIDSGSWVGMSVDSKGNYTISNDQLAAGSHTITIEATDTKGNTTASAYTFTLVVASQVENINASVTADGTGTAKLPAGLTIRSIEGQTISVGKTLTLSGNRGTVSLAADGKVTFTPGSSYKKLAQGEKETLSLGVVSADAYGHAFTSSLIFTVTGKNDLPTLTSTTRPNTTVQENGSATVAVATLLSRWTDPDNGAVLSLASIAVESVSCTNSALAGTYTTTALKNYVSLTSTGVKLDATGSFFDALGAGESLTVTVSYKVKDQYGTSADTGHLTLTVTGKNDAPTLTARQTDGFRYASNSKTNATIDPGFTKSDADRNDPASSLVYDLDKTSKALGFTINERGVITIDADRKATLNGNYTLTVTLRDGHGGSASQKIGVAFYAEPAPSLAEAIISITEKCPAASKDLNDFVTKLIGHDYSFSQPPTPTHYSTDGTHWISFDGNDDVLTGRWNFNASTGVFVFSPNGEFDALAADETFYIRFEYGVSDDSYNNCGSTGRLTMKIVGENDLPVQKTDATPVYVIVSESTTAPTKKIENLLDGWADADHAGSELKISDVRISETDAGSLISLAELQSAATDFLKITDHGRSVEVDPSHEMFRRLGIGQHVTITLEYTVVDPRGGIGTGRLTLRIDGANDSPVFVAPGLIRANASDVTSLDWQHLFTDPDENDTLTLTGINDCVFDEQGKVVIDGIGEFHLDGNGVLRFVPDTAFDSMKYGDKSSELNVTLDVIDAAGAAPVDPADITLLILGTNKAPAVTATDLAPKKVDEPITIRVSDIAADVNGDALRFHSVEINGVELVSDANWNIAKNAWILRLASGGTATLGVDATTLTIDGTTRNEFLSEGKTENLALNIVVADVHDALSAKRSLETGFLGIPAAPPQVENILISGLAEDDTDIPDEIVLANLITDLNTPHRDADWYAIDWTGLVSATIDGRTVSKERLAKLSELFRYENGVFRFSRAPAGHFDFLSENETLKMIFAYTVTDDTLKDAFGNPVKSTGNVTVEIAGRNSSPTISGDDRFAVTVSGVPNGSPVAVGRFETTDADDGDVVTVSIEHVSGQKGDKTLAILPTFKIDDDGNLTMLNDGVPELEPGESAVYKVEILARDRFGGTTRKSVFVSVYAKNPASIEIDPSKPNVAENDLAASIPIDVTDTPDAFREATRTGHAWYAAPTIENVTVSSEFRPNVSDPASFFAVGGNSTDGYSLDFVAAKSDFSFLREGEVLVFTLTLVVTDPTYGVTSTKTVTVSITGVGDAHSVVTNTNSFEHWANQRENRPTGFDPVYNIYDADWNSEYVYSLQDIEIDTLPEGFDLDTLEKLISIDAETGALTLDEVGLAGLTSGFSYTLTIRVASTGEYADGHYADVDVTLKVKVAGAPVIDASDTTIDETQNVSVTVDVGTPDDAPRPGEGYEISGPVLVDIDDSGSLPEGFDWNDILAEIAYFDGDKFVFATNSRLDFLPKGSTLLLTYEFTVTDKTYAVATTETITVTVTGVNNEPVARDTTVAQAIPDNTTEGARFYLADLASDTDLGDTLRFHTVDGRAIMKNGAAVNLFADGKRLGSVYYLSDKNGDYLLFFPDESFKSLRSGATETVRFDYDVIDDSGVVSNSATLSCDVVGTNKRPVIELPGGTVAENKTYEITASDIASDTNVGDTLRIAGFRYNNTEYRIVDGKPVVLVLESGATVTLDAAGRLRYDPSTRHVNMSADDSDVERFELLVADDSGDGDSAFSNWKKFTLRVEGVNEGPSDILPDTTEYDVTLTEDESELRIDLSTHFADADKDDLLTFSLLNNLSRLGFLSVPPKIVDDHILVLKFVGTDDDSIDFDFSEIALTITADDGRESIGKTLTIRANRLSSPLESEDDLFGLLAEYQLGL